MDNIEEQIKQLQEEMLTHKKSVLDAQKTAEVDEVAAKALAEAEKKLADQLKEVREQKRQLQDDYLKRARAIKEARRLEEEANRRLQKLLDEQNARKVLSELGDKFDQITAGAPWREWAYSHQISGAKHIAATKRVILGDKRGLGKTLTSLIAMDMLQAKKTIIFTPKDVSLNFEAEVKKWTPNRPVMVLTSASKGFRDALLVGVKAMPDVTIIINYEAARRDESLIERLIECQFDTVIIDEAHKIKKYDGIDYKNIERLIAAKNCCPSCRGMKFEQDFVKGSYCVDCLYRAQNSKDFCSVENVVPMTGTSMINAPQDIWPLLKLVDPVGFGSRAAFLREYCMQDLNGRWRFQWGGEERLLKRLGMRFIGRNPKSAGVKMPPQTEQRHIITFDPIAYPKQWEMMYQIREYAAVVLSEDVALTVPGKLAQLTRLMQALTCPSGIKIYDTRADGTTDYKNVLYTSDVTESIKLDKAIEIIEEAIEEGDRVVLFSRFKEVLKEMEKRLTKLGISAIRYDGDISDRAARAAQIDFDIKTAPNHSKDESCNDQCPNWDAALAELDIEQTCNGYKSQVFLGQYQKAGTGLNLTGARQEVIIDRYYAYAYEDQAAGRIQRLDSRKESIVHQIIVESHQENKVTVDQWMDELITSKKNMSEDYDNAHLATDFMRAIIDGDII